MFVSHWHWFLVLFQVIFKWRSYFVIFPSTNFYKDCLFPLWNSAYRKGVMVLLNKFWPSFYFINKKISISYWNYGAPPPDSRIWDIGFSAKDDGIWKCRGKILLSWLSWEYYKGFVTFVTFARWVLLPSLPNSNNLVKWPKTDLMWQGDHTKDVPFHKSGQGCIGCRNNILCIHLLLCFTSTSTGCVVPTGSFNTNILV